jgi:hypothetical protein
MTMRDEMDMRMWNAHHVEFSHGLDRLMDVFRQLVAIQYAAPWQAPREECRP